MRDQLRIAVVSSFDLAIRNGGTARTEALARILSGLGHEVVRFCPGEAAAGDQADDGAGIRLVRANVAPLGQRQVPRFLRKLKRLIAPLPTVLGARADNLREAVVGDGHFDLVVASYPGASQYLGIGDATWVDFHDAHSRYALREARKGPLAMAPGALLQSLVYRRDELRLIQSATYVSAAGFIDREVLHLRSGRNIVWIPTPVRAPLRPSLGPGRHIAGMIADFHYGPNIDALDLLLKSWLGPLRSSGWQVVLAGRGSDEVQLPDGVTAMGYVESPDEFYRQVDLALAPIRRGGGVKVKVLEAIARRRPILATEFAVEGLRKPLPPGVCIVPGDLKAVPVIDSIDEDSTAGFLASDYSYEAAAAAIGRMLSPG